MTSPIFKQNPKQAAKQAPEQQPMHLDSAQQQRQERLLAAARKVYTAAYAPYSKFFVGSAIAYSPSAMPSLTLNLNQAASKESDSIGEAAQNGMREYTDKREESIACGVNVENCSYGLTVCAERNAIAAAVLNGCKNGDVTGVAVVAKSSRPTAPCGACRQVLAEFCAPAVVVSICNLTDDTVLHYTIEELLPCSFTPSNLTLS